MAFEHKDNSGSIFRNDKRDNDRQPTHQGSCKINNQEFWISAWVNETKAGAKYFSLKFQPKEGEFVRSSDKPQDFDDDVPFNQEVA